MTRLGSDASPLRPGSIRGREPCKDVILPTQTHYQPPEASATSGFVDVRDEKIRKQLPVLPTEQYDGAMLWGTPRLQTWTGG